MKNFKSKKIICIVAISLILIFIYIVYANKDNKKSFVYKNVTYALKVDGQSVSSFPKKGTYRVDVECENAKGKWNYINWELEISSINGNISCSIDFNTIEKTAFADYLMTLEGQTQGNGKFIHEVSVVQTPTYNTVTPLTQSEYGTPTVYYTSNDAYETTGTTVSNLLSFSNNEWSVNTANIPKNWTYYHFKFSVPEEGYYQVCYNMGTGSASNRLWVYNGESAILEALKANTSNASTGCVNLGLVKTDSFIKVVQAEIKSGTYPTLTFSIKKADPNDVLETRTDADYRYQGKSPYNYVWFNDEYWRVIGVFDERSHGIADKKLVKLIRARAIGGLVYNTTASNTWSTASLNSLLNGAFYNRTNGTNSGYCQTSNGITGSCDYSFKGIMNEYKSMIKDAKWFTNGISNTAITSSEIYTAERSDSSNSSTAHIGLMYASDYGFSTLAESCNRDTSLSAYNIIGCSGTSWLSGFNWTITPIEVNSSYVTLFDYNGTATGGSVQGASSIKPVLYLNENVYIIDGNGTVNDPYILGI